MTRMDVSTLTLDSLQYVCRNLREKSRKEIFACRWSEDPDALAEELLKYCSTFAWCGSLERPIYAGGAVEIWPGVWQTWGFGTDEFDRIAIQVTKFVRRRMIESLKKLGCHRLESKCIAGDPEVVKWMTLLGATQEAVLHGYGKQGEDFTLYTWSFK